MSNKISVFFLLFLLSWLACNIAQGNAGEIAKASSASNASPLRIDIPRARDEHANVPALRLPARVELDESRLAKIGSAVSGRVVAINGLVGQSVHQGDVLARIQSRDLGAAQSAFLKFLTQVDLKKLAAARTTRLAAAGAVSSVIRQERQQELAEVEVGLRAATDQLRLMGMSEAGIQHLSETRAIDSALSIVATASGTLIERNIALGQIVQSADTLYGIADLSEVWVSAEVPERDIHSVNAGDEVEAEIPAASDEPIKGRLLYVADTVNPQTRTLTVRMALPNPQRLFKPQMLATLMVCTPSASALILSDATGKENGAW